MMVRPVGAVRIRFTSFLLEKALAFAIVRTVERFPVMFNQSFLAQLASPFALVHLREMLDFPILYKDVECRVFLRAFFESFLSYWGNC